MLAKYYAVLEVQGVSGGETERRIKLIQSRMSNADGSKLFYNKTYTRETPNYNEQPNAYLSRMVQNRKSGKALDFEMGQGRNAIFLSKNGWEVTGFDVAEEGVALARRNAEGAGVRLNAIAVSADRLDWGEGVYDLVVAT